MSLFALLSVLVTLAAIFSLISTRWLRLPTTVGVMILSILTSGILMFLGRTSPHLNAVVATTMQRIDFAQVVLHGMLAFLLFAGSLNLNVQHLVSEKLPVFVLSVFGTLISTAIVAGLLMLIFLMLHLPGTWTTCLLFGSLISPTDPIAVLEMLRRVGVPLRLETQLTGESLFNDGIGAVLFLTFLGASTQPAKPHLGAFLLLLLIKAGGGIVLGVALGYLTYRCLRLLDSYRVEVLLTIALAMGGYALADALRVSAPLEAVTAGLLVGGRARRFAMSAVTRDNVDTFWELTDDILNVVLFLLLGLELLAMSWSRYYIYVGLLAVPAVLIARFASVSACSGILHSCGRQLRGGLAVLTWGGLRGGLAIALALSLNPGPSRDMLLFITYLIVVFSIVVQGLTMERFLRAFLGEKLFPRRSRTTLDCLESPVRLRRTDAD